MLCSSHILSYAYVYTPKFTKECILIWRQESGNMVLSSKTKLWHWTTLLTRASSTYVSFFHTVFCLCLWMPDLWTHKKMPDALGTKLIDMSLHWQCGWVDNMNEISYQVHPHGLIPDNGCRSTYPSGMTIFPYSLSLLCFSTFFHFREWITLAQSSGLPIPWVQVSPLVAPQCNATMSLRSC